MSAPFTYGSVLSTLPHPNTIVERHEAYLFSLIQEMWTAVYTRIKEEHFPRTSYCTHIYVPRKHEDFFTPFQVAIKQLFEEKGAPFWKCSRVTMHAPEYRDDTMKGTEIRMWSIEFAAVTQ